MCVVCVMVTVAKHILSLNSPSPSSSSWFPGTSSVVSSTSDGDDDGEVEVGEESQYLGGCFESTTAGVTGAEL